MILKFNVFVFPPSMNFVFYIMHVILIVIILYMLLICWIQKIKIYSGRKINLYIYL